MPSSSASAADYIREHIRTVPDWPGPGVQFRDITPLLSNPRVFRVLIDQFVHRYFDHKPTAIAGLDARGFIIGSVLAYELNIGFIPIRKKGKLPHKRVSIAYSLEYGLDEMEIHEDAVVRGERVIVVDDLIATGGTAEGAVKLLRQMGAEVLAACFIVDLPDLGGADKIRKLDVPVRTLISFEGH
jgi:adenine phosphoribosyltransferase